MLESKLEPEFVSLLEVLRRPDPAVVPGSQMARARDVPAKIVTGAYLMGRERGMPLAALPEVASGKGK